MDGAHDVEDSLERCMRGPLDQLRSTNVSYCSMYVSPAYHTLSG